MNRNYYLYCTVGCIMVKAMYSNSMYKLIDHEGFNNGFGRTLRKGWNETHLVLNLRRKLIRIVELDEENRVQDDWIIDIDFSKDGMKIGHEGIDHVLSRIDHVRKSNLWG